MEELNDKYTNHIVYKTTNLISDRIYIGIHSQNGEEFDGYLGSGKWFRRSVKYHGGSNFKRETLYSYVTREEALEKESQIVNEEFLSRSDVYNLTLGGKDNVIINCLSKDSRDKRTETINRKYGGINNILNVPEVRLKVTNILIERYGENHMSRMHTTDALEKSRVVKYNKALIRYPYLISKCKLVSTDGVEVISGTLYDIAVHCYGTEYAITKHNTLYDKLKTGKKVTQGIRKGYKVIPQE